MNAVLAPAAGVEEKRGFSYRIGCCLPAPGGVAGKYGAGCERIYAVGRGRVR